MRAPTLGLTFTSTHGKEIQNATRESARIISPAFEKSPGLVDTNAFLSLVIASILLTMGIVEAAIYFQSRNSGASVAAASPAASSASRPASFTGTISGSAILISREKLELEEFSRRLVDPNAFFLRFQDATEEKLYAKVTKDEGMEIVHNTLTRIMPRLLLQMTILILAVIELATVLYPNVLWHSDRVFATRPFYIISMGGILFLLCLASLLLRMKITTRVFPFVSFFCAVIVFALTGICFAIMIRYGAKSGNQPWDGEVRVVVILLLIFIPRMLNLPILLATVFNFIAVVALEMFFMLLYQSYGYRCGCYYLFGSTITKVGLSNVAFVIIIIH